MGCSKFEQSFIIIKPDTIQRELVRELENEINKTGLKIVKRGKIKLNVEFIKELYQWPALNYPNLLHNYLCGMPLPLWLIIGDRAIELILSVKKEFRKKYCTDKLHTLFHCPDSAEEAAREFKLIINNLKEANMKTDNQIEVIIFKKNEDGAYVFLMLKRNQAKGGFWQPITGNVEKNETFDEAASRELKEETGITETIRLFDTGYYFEFFDDNRQQHEKIYAAEINNETVITLSSEHTEFAWVSAESALEKYLKYPGNKEGLKKLNEKLKKET